MEPSAIVNGSFENWASATDLSNATETLAGSSTINQSTDVVSGNYALRYDIDSSNSLSYVQMASTIAKDRWVNLSAYMKASASGKTGRFDLGTAQTPTYTFETSYTRHDFTLRTAAANPIPFIYRITANSASLYFDNFSINPLTLSSLFATLSAGASNVIVTAKIYALTPGTTAGVVANLDSASSPANFLVAYHDGTNLKLDKCVAGVYTNLVSTAVAFSSDAQIEIRRPSGNTFQVWYGGTQRGTDQTVSDAGIISNTLYGLFSTYSGNLLSQLSLGGVVIPFGFEGQPGSWNGLLALGDSKTEGDAWVGLLAAALQTATNSAWREQTPRLAVPGHTAATLKAYVLANLYTVARAPSLIIINMGVNDAIVGLPAEATWKADMTATIDALRSAYPSSNIYLALVGTRGQAANCNTVDGWITDVVASYPSGVHVGMDERIWFENGDDYTALSLSNDGLHYNATTGQTAAVTAWMTALGH